MSGNASVGKKSWFIYGAILALVPLLVLIYACLLLILTWPVSEWSVSKSGVFGDSFGVLTSLFSGLAFSGMIATILLQRDELELQRGEIRDNQKQFERSALAQERGARLSALSTLLLDCKEQIERYEDANKKSQFSQSDDFMYLEVKISKLNKHKADLIAEIEKILTSYSDSDI